MAVTPDKLTHKNIGSLTKEEILSALENALSAGYWRGSQGAPLSGLDDYAKWTITIKELRNGPVYCQPCKF